MTTATEDYYVNYRHSSQYEPATISTMSQIMTPIMSDIKSTACGISSPQSSTGGGGYSCAYPSWPNRPCLDSRTPPPHRQPPTSAAKHAIPSLEFLESLRRRPRPESVFEDDDEEDDGFVIGGCSVTSDSSATSSGCRGHPLLPPARTVQRSNSLLSQAFSQLHHHNSRRAA